MARLDTNFKKDQELYGSVGENWLLQRLTTSPKTKQVIDVSDNPTFIKHDVDLIQVTGEPFDLKDLVKVYSAEKIYNGNAVIYEVKTDTQILKTGNIAYEIMSNTNPGCFARTLSNYIVYVGINRERNNAVESVYLLDTYSLREWVLTHWADNVMKPYYMDHKNGDRTALLLIPIERLQKDRVAKAIIK